MPSANFRLARRGLLFVISSPSGAGKSTIARKLLEEDDEIHLSVSVTTRPMRPGEIDGVDYHFVDVPEFKKMVAEDQLLEWAHVFDNRYGTPRKPVEEMVHKGQDVLFDIDWQGAQQLWQQASGDTIRVYILPPSVEELERRLRGRGTDSEEVIKKRMARAASEISHWDGYDYVLINDDIEECFQQVRNILKVERIKRRRQIGLIGFTRKLLAPPEDK
ncbi:MAG: guanylate kinase [Zymomonas mobilis subsp. pomaceae]|uniref:Guanylate kinase n=1 Tax=Zymomonas mobilis subsp. pomaceae (strain ATCC 29192 / DSM 22645 / JCM 10191 / CCUG 17912 / NBRC 13757 / NCIMB 11200 / NRRL B-4491 / Barker I) TaxID=579138 RepID=F8ESA3_ZYMMT|nr:guanylate kinase [Zymomonas mobilis]AEI37678.1 guanylate kinase [Zymomonas mobilis subsp. pomaceae ATCC 29192]MDX5949045.1 guanylate kinase [Zymomonas mobilis subsp. pomaceae]GEB88850.1 guanylate kinase [Zymomonas mobilis subsp. pomaceae]